MENPIDKAIFECTLHDEKNNKISTIYVRDCKYPFRTTDKEFFPDEKLRLLMVRDDLEKRVSKMMMCINPKIKNITCDCKIVRI